MAFQRFVFVAVIMLVFMASLSVRAQQVEAPTPTPGGSSDNSNASPNGLVLTQQILLGFVSIGMSMFLFFLKHRV